MEESAEWGTLSPEEFAQLQKYLDYSSRKVQDVLQEFYGDGVLSQHLQGECVDFEGFKLFLRSYLEAADVPDTLCHHLFRSFQSTGQTDADADLVCVNDVSCYFSLLEGGRPEDKLEFTFKLYDKDGNGLLDSSVRGQGRGGHLGPPSSPLPSSSPPPCCRRWSGSSPR